MLNSLNRKEVRHDEHAKELADAEGRRAVGKSSVKGGQYLTGRLGGVKVLVMENRDRQTDDDPSHHLFFVGADRRQVQRRGRRSVSGARGLNQPRRPRRHQTRTAGPPTGMAAGARSSGAARL